VKSDKKLQDALQEAQAEVRELKAQLDSYRQTDLKLSETEATLDSVLNALPVGVIIADVGGKLLSLNPAARELWGAPPETTNWEQYARWVGYRPVTGERIKAAEWAMSRALNKGEIVTGELVEYEKFGTGERGFLLNNAAPIRDAEGQIIAGVVVELDVTERLAAERALRESEERFRTMADGLPLIVWVHDAEGRQQFVNRTFSEFFGVSLDEMKGGRWQLLMHPEDAEAYSQEFLHCLQERRPFHGETRVRDAKGEWRWIESWGRPRWSASGEFLGFVGTSADITERLAAERALRESESFYRQTLESIPGMVFTTRPDGYCDYQSKQWVDYTGVPLSEQLGDGWNKLLHPDDQARALDAWKAAVEGKASYDLEYRVRRHDGSHEWFKVIGRPIRDAAGEVARWFGAAINVEDLKRSEQALRDSEAQAKARAEELTAMMEAVPAITFLAHDRECRQMSSSRATRELLRVPEGGNVSASAPAGDLQSTYRTLKDGRELIPEELPVQMAAATGREVRDFGLTIAFKDGTSREIFGNAVPLFDPSGSVRGAVGAFLDVTELRRAEEALERANEELEAKVRERTRELRKLVHTLELEVKQRQEAEEQLRVLAGQLRALAGELTLTEQRERRRLGKILHDHLQQLLVGAKFRVAILARTGDDLICEAASEIDRLLAESINVSRSLTAELSPPILQEGGLQAGLEWLARWMRDKHALQVDLKTQDGFPDLPNEMTALLFESLRELLFNTVKHAGVSSADVSIRPLKDRSLRIQVRDEGRGFDPTSIAPSSGGGGGFGLFSIRERMNLIGGKVEIDSAPGQGASVILTVSTERGPAVREPAPLEERRLVNEQPKPEVPRSGDPIRVLLVDDHAVVRDGLTQLLGQEPDIDIVGQATDGQEAVQLARLLLPDVILMDIGLPRLNGIEATRLIISELPDIRIIGLSMFEEEDRARAMREAGAADYQTKSGSTAGLLDAIRSARIGRS
jgi:PAS domain S-box-containing protein